MMTLNPNIPEVYIDGIGKNRYSGGVVRLDLVSANGTLDEQTQKVSTTVTQCLVMSPEGFLRTVATLNGLLKKLVEAGVVTQRPATPQAAAASVSKNGA